MVKAFVHRYKYSHDKRRRQLFKALKLGKVKLLTETASGWLFEVPKEFPLHPTRHR